MLLVVVVVVAGGCSAPTADPKYTPGTELFKDHRPKWRGVSRMLHREQMRLVEQTPPPQKGLITLVLWVAAKREDGEDEWEEGRG